MLKVLSCAKLSWLREWFYFLFFYASTTTTKKSSYLLDFLVLLLLLFLALFLCVVVYQGLVPLGQEGKVDFSVALVTFPAAGGGIGPPVLVPCVKRPLLVIHAVLVPLIFCSTYVCGSVSCCISVKHWWKRFGLHVACLSLAAALGDVKRREKKKTWPQEVRYDVRRGFVHEWKCIPVVKPYEGDLAQSP